ncbi:MAG: hypothetical protein SGJ19_08805 [Planctomycetia bacterium]|nr:hypothetical protein [Planctomycetia bacterium]
MANTVDSMPLPTKMHEDCDRPPTERAGGTTSSAVRMSRTMVNLLLDATLLIVLTAVLAVGLVVQFVFPPGTSADGWTLWGWSYNAWSRWQFGLISLLTLGVLVHVMLHWSWVCGVVVSKLLRQKRPPQMDDGIRTLYGVATLIVLLGVIGVIVAAANLAVRSAPLPGAG